MTIDEILKTPLFVVFVVILAIAGICCVIIAIIGKFPRVQITGKGSVSPIDIEGKRAYALLAFGILLIIVAAGLVWLSLTAQSTLPIAQSTLTPLPSSTVTHTVEPAETPVPPTPTSTFTQSPTPTDTPTPSPTPTPECRFNDLFKCSTLVPIYVEGESRLTATNVLGNLVVDFSNNQNSSGVALVFGPALNVRDFAYVEISGTSTRVVTFLIEYKTRSGAQLTIVTTSPFQSFLATTSTAQTIRIPLAYNGAVDEVVINFYNIGESSTVVIESMRLSQ